MADTGDVRLPGLLYARVLRPPAHGATLKSVDTAPAEPLTTVVGTFAETPLGNPLTTAQTGRNF